MDSLKEQLFPSEFVLDYIQDGSRKKRFLTYVMFRFLSFVGEENPSLPKRLKETLSCPFTPQAFCVIDDYLMEDYYFSPSLKQNSYEPLYLYAAISLQNSAHDCEMAFFETLLTEHCPVAASICYEDPELILASLLQTGADFYAALYLATAKYETLLPSLLPKFTEAYEESFHFTCEDFILFDFMDEYFEEKHCICHASFTELIDTLVAATLNYYHTDFDTLLAKDITQALSGSASRFAGTKRIGSIAVTPAFEHDTACRMLADSFRYAAMYELRNNLFDFHLEDDKLITLTNWKENLRWHYVQYANVYDLALDSFHIAILSRELLKAQFAENLRQ